MSLSRRALFAREPRSSANLRQLISARGREALVAELGPGAGESGLIPPPQSGEIRLTSNENPLGPFPASMAAIHGAFAGASRYPDNVQPSRRLKKTDTQTPIHTVVDTVIADESKGKIGRLKSGIVILRRGGD